MRGRPRVVRLETLAPKTAFRFRATKTSTVHGTVGDNPGEGVEVLLTPVESYRRYPRRVYWSGKTLVEPL